jgi:hypothetical protein
MHGTAKISSLEVIPIAAPDQARNDLDGTVDTVIVKIADENGLFSIGEEDAPPQVIKAFIEMPTAHLWSRNAIEILVGADPIETAAIWQRLYDGTFWPGRRGLGTMLFPPSTSRFTISPESSSVFPLTRSWAERAAKPYAPIAPSIPGSPGAGRSANSCARLDGNSKPRSRPAFAP